MMHRKRIRFLPCDSTVNAEGTQEKFCTFVTPRFGGVTMFAGYAGRTRRLCSLLAAARAIRRIRKKNPS